MLILPTDDNQPKDSTGISASLSASIELITPEKAVEILSRMVDNRHPNERRVREYAQRMLSGEWRISDPIKFDTEDRLYDGQHRVMAVVKAGIPVEFAVIRNMPTNAKLYCDMGQARSTLHIANIMGLRLQSTKISCTKEIMRMTYILQSAGISHHLAIKMYMKYSNGVDFACRNIKCESGVRIQNSCFPAAIAKAYFYENHATLDRFARAFYTGFAEGEHEYAAITLRNSFLKEAKGKLGGSERVNWTYKTLSAIQHFIKKNPVKRISAASQDPYPLPDTCKDSDEYAQKRLRYFNEKLLTTQAPVESIELPE